MARIPLDIQSHCGVDTVAAAIQNDCRRGEVVLDVDVLDVPLGVGAAGGMAETRRQREW